MSRGYRYDIRHLSPQAQVVITKRDEENERLRKESNKREQEKTKKEPLQNDSDL